MKILVDENIPRVTVDYLRDSGHDVRDVRGTVERDWMIRTCGPLL
jgi:predicted nuclease of predicted toxin-antitoxin system